MHGSMRFHMNDFRKWWTSRNINVLCLHLMKDGVINGGILKAVSQIMQGKLSPIHEGAVEMFWELILDHDGH